MTILSISMPEELVERIHAFADQTVHPGRREYWP